MIEFAAGFLAAYGLGFVALVVYAILQRRKETRLREAVRQRLLDDLTDRVTRPSGVNTSDDELLRKIERAAVKRAKATGPYPIRHN